MMKLTAAFVASMSLLASCKKEEPKPAPKTAEQALAEAMKAMGAATGSGSATTPGDLGAAIGAMAAMGAPGGGAPAAGSGSGSAMDAASAAAGLGKAAAMLGALAGMGGAGGSLSAENQATIGEFNTVVTQLQALVTANPDNCAALGASMAPVVATHAPTFAKMKSLKGDEAQKAAIGLALLAGPVAQFSLTMLSVGLKCKDDASFTKAWDGVKDAF